MLISFTGSKINEKKIYFLSKGDFKKLFSTQPPYKITFLETMKLEKR